MLDPFKVLDVTDWSIDAQESRGGKRTKVWVLDPQKQSWLRKEPLPRSPSEAAIEVFTLRLARAVGLPAPEGHAARWVEGDHEKRGIVVRNFVEDESTEFAEGAQVLGGADAQYDSENPNAHTLARVEEGLSQGQLAADVASLRTALLDILIFDAWVGNGDRHPGNWGILRAPERPTRLAPLYDTAACLGSALQDSYVLLNPKLRKLDHLSAYVANCPSGFGDGQGLIGQVDLVQGLRRWPEWSGRHESWVRRFGEVIDSVGEYFAGIPEDWLGSQRKWLATELLKLRLQWLLERR